MDKAWLCRRTCWSGNTLSHYPNTVMVLSANYYLISTALIPNGSRTMRQLNLCMVPAHWGIPDRMWWTQTSISYGNIEFAMRNPIQMVQNLRDGFTVEISAYVSRNRCQQGTDDHRFAPDGNARSLSDIMKLDPAPTHADLQQFYETPSFQGCSVTRALS